MNRTFTLCFLLYPIALPFGYVLVYTFYHYAVPDANSDLTAYREVSISIPDGSKVTGNRTGVFILQNRWILINGEVSLSFVNMTNWSQEILLSCSEHPIRDTNFTAIDETGYGFTCSFKTTGLITMSLRGYIPENKSQILRFSHIAFMSV